MYTYIYKPFIPYDNMKIKTEQQERVIGFKMLYINPDHNSKSAEELVDELKESGGE